MKAVNARILHAALRVFAEKGSMQIAISDLAKEAGLSRGTIYNNLENPDELFNQMCDLLYLELRQAMRENTAHLDDPAQRLALVIRQTIRRVHEEHHWGKFIAQFGMLDPRLGKFWGKLPRRLLMEGLESGRFSFDEEQLPSITALGGGAVMGATSMVLTGLVTWRQSSADTAELYLRAIGVPRDEARAICARRFEPLPRLDFTRIELPQPVEESAPS
jgi:AcrR family transcriptional regulator